MRYEVQKPRRVRHEVFMFGSDGRGFCYRDKVICPHGVGRVVGADVPVGYVSDHDKGIRLKVVVSEPLEEYRDMVGDYPRHVLCYWIDELERMG